MSQIPQLWFHEATVLIFNKNENSIKLELEDVTTGETGECKSHVVIFCNAIRNIKSDAQECNSNLMAAEDGEVLTLKLSKNGMQLIVEWHDYTHHSYFINYYEIDCEDIQIEARPMDMLNP